MNNAELTEQLAVLQAKFDELNARMDSMNAHRPATPRSWLGRRIRPVVWQAGILGLFLVTAVAQTKDPITVAPDGSVRIGTSLQSDGTVTAKNFSGDGSTLSIGQDTLGTALGKKIDSGPDNSIPARSYISFTNTNHEGSADNRFEGNAAIDNGKAYHALMLLGRYESGWGNRRLVRAWDTLGIGGDRNSTFDGQLDVKGEIRGKLWRSQSYQWDQGKSAVKMSRSDHAVCFLQAVRGKFMGHREMVQILEKDGYWWLGGDSQQQDVMAQAVCVGAPDDSW